MEKEVNSFQNMAPSISNSIGKLPKLQHVRTRFEKHDKNVRTISRHGLSPVSEMQGRVARTEDVGVLAKHLTLNTKVDENFSQSNMSHFLLGDKGAIAIARGIKDVSDPLSPTANRRGPLSPRCFNTEMSDAATAECSSPKPMKHLGTLILSNNAITKRGAIEVCESLSNTSINILDLSDNSLGYEGGVALSKMLSSPNCVITSLVNIQLLSEIIFCQFLPLSSNICIYRT